MKQLIKFEAAYDKRDSDPSKNFGVHGVNLNFVLIGEKGAVSFLVFTNWMLPDQLGITGNAWQNWHKYTDALESLSGPLRAPMPADLGYHSHEPVYEDQWRSDACEWLGGKPCYYDGSSLNAQEVFFVLTREGSDGVWRYLENYYNEVFNETEED